MMLVQILCHGSCLQQRGDLLISAVLTSCKNGEEFVHVQQIVLPSHSLNLSCQEQSPSWALCSSNAIAYGYRVIAYVVSGNPSFRWKKDGRDARG